MFVDTINTPTVKKKLQKLSAQDPGESRRRWQRVTEALFSRDIEEATDAKHEVSPLVLNIIDVLHTIDCRVFFYCCILSVCSCQPQNY